MSLKNKFSKMKSFLFDEDEEIVEKPSKKIKEKPKQEEREIKKVVIKEEKETFDNDLFFEDVTDFKVEEPKVNNDVLVGSRMEKKESEFKFPDFSDDDFLIPVKEPEPAPVIKKVEEKPKVALYQGSKRREETKKFKPSPIISPIYGLLDDEGNVSNKSSKKEASTKQEEITFDDVRKKAYGSIDDEFEDTLKRLSNKTIEEAEKDEEERLSRTKKNKNVSEEKINKIKKVEVEEIEDDDMILPNVNFKEIDIDKEKNKKVISSKVKPRGNDDDDDDDTKEQDLFNLIDTMYSKKERE